MSHLSVVDIFVFGPFSNLISYSDLCCIEFVVVKGCSKAVLRKRYWVHLVVSGCFICCRKLSHQILCIVCL
jgi:hypothetical protein